ncbi:hypothetical protein OHC33_007781 [Knufia fluminis]|uniref:DUF3669 domain-containing protein n=1 Tax=Knufia fluminis TaxID=191047 RepID=A0AAN8ES76_9EURO|nr:hypothetical protein OHC33_007781 [Knufia fluminis]
MASPPEPNDDTASNNGPTFTEIGRGTFGIIFTDPTSTSPSRHHNRILKRTLVPNVDPRGWLEQDAYWHERMYDVFRRASNVHSKSGSELGLGINLPSLPEYYGVHRSTSQFWRENAGVGWRVTGSDNGVLHTNPDLEDIRGRMDYAIPSSLLCAQRIPPIEHATRSALLTAFFPDMPADIRRTTLESKWNWGCLLRVYFGEDSDNHNLTSQIRTRVRRSGTESDEGGDVSIPNLRNFPLSRDRLMRALAGEGYEDVIKSMAAAMATLHWEVGCDGRDCEFVFGGGQPTSDPTRSSAHSSDDADSKANGDSKRGKSKSKSRTFKLFGQHEVQMWLLDFNQVSAITRDEAGVSKAVLGLLENDPYFPKPGQGRVGKDWEVFKGEYLFISKMILERGRDGNGNGEEGEAEGQSADVSKLPESLMREVERRHGLNDYQRLFGSDEPSGTYGGTSLLQSVLGYLY